MKRAKRPGEGRPKAPDENLLHIPEKNEFSEYAKFAIANRGYQFQNRETGKILSVGFIYPLFQDKPVGLILLTKNLDDEWERIKKYTRKRKKE